MKEFECVCSAHGSCVGNDFDAAVMAEGGGEIPRFYGVVPPCVSSAWLDMDHALSANGCHGS